MSATNFDKLVPPVKFTRPGTPTPPATEAQLQKPLKNLLHRLRHLARKPESLNTDVIASISRSLSSLLDQFKTIRMSEKESVRNTTDELVDEVTWLYFRVILKDYPEVEEGLVGCFIALVGVERRIEDMKKACTSDDILSVQEELAKIEETMKRTVEEYVKIGSVAHGEAAVRGKLEHCYRQVWVLLREQEKIDPELLAVHDKLVGIKQEVDHMIQHPASTSQGHIRKIQTELDAIEAQRAPSGYFPSKSDPKVIPRGQSVLTDILSLCYDEIQELNARDEIGGELRPVYERLLELRALLEKMYNGWYEEGQLEKVQEELDGIDSKHCSNVVDESKDKTVIRSMLHKCYRMVYLMQCALEEIEEEVEDMARKMCEEQLRESGMDN